MKKHVLLLVSALLTLCTVSLSFAQDKIAMKDVRTLAKQSVDDIFRTTPIETFTLERYWQQVQGREKPLVVFFYANLDGPSQRVATLIHYIAPEYADKLSFAKVKVGETSKPSKKEQVQLNKAYSLDSTPGILFYDNVGQAMVLEDEDYIEADFKEFRTPSMLLWRTYYNAVRKELNKLLAD